MSTHVLRESVSEWLSILRCPTCFLRTLVVERSGIELSCSHCTTKYPISLGRPVLIRSDNRLFSSGSYLGVSPKSAKRLSLSRFAPSPSLNLARGPMLAALAKRLTAIPSPAILVIGAGQQRQELAGAFRSLPNVRLLCTDIDVDGDVDVFCDAHDLPFVDRAFDAIVTTAVLEHVVYPEQVASELHRVSADYAFIYSELPFIQQVHEGAHDFTRYTLLGHRRLLNGFQELQSGMVAGPGTALVWSTEHFLVAFTSRPFLRALMRALARFAFFWLKYFDYVFQRRGEAMDGASCTFFLGFKVADKIPDEQIVASYHSPRSDRP